MTWTVDKCPIVAFGNHADTLVFQLHVQWNGAQPVEVQVFDGTIGFEGSPQLWPSLRFPLGPREVAPHQKESFYLPVRADPRVLSFIEGFRAGRSSVTFKVSGMLLWKAVEYVQLSNGGGLRVLGRPEAQHLQIDPVVQRDQWHSHLQQLDWGRFEVFEIPLRLRNQDLSGSPTAGGSRRPHDLAARASSSISRMHLRQAIGLSWPPAPTACSEVLGNNRLQKPHSSTPEEVLDESYQLLRRKLAEDLLERVKSCSPRFFENLVVDVLVAMGYGGSRKDAGRVIGKSGDEGIDGLINEDRLGLDVVYVQAKRWSRTVGRPEIQAFAGSLEGKRARKGVFITTSDFSREATEYVQHIEKKIVLVDGGTLALLMMDHGVGVSEVASYSLKRIDSDFERYNIIEDQDLQAAAKAIEAIEAGQPSTTSPENSSPPSRDLNHGAR